MLGRVAVFGTGLEALCSSGKSLRLTAEVLSRYGYYSIDLNETRCSAFMRLSVGEVCSQMWPPQSHNDIFHCTAEKGLHCEIPQREFPPILPTLLA